MGHLEVGPLHSSLPSEKGQSDRLGLNLGRMNVVYSECGNPALDHLSTLIQFHLLSPRVRLSTPLLLSIPPLRK